MLMVRGLGVVWRGLDGGEVLHHGEVVKRITISLEDDLYRVAKAYAISEDISLSKAITFFVRRGVEGGKSVEGRVGEEGGTYSYIDPRTGIMVTSIGRKITEEEVRKAMDSEDDRHLEIFYGKD